MVATHGCFGGGSIVVVRARAKPHKRGQAVAESNPVGDEAGGAPISVGKWVDACPLGVRPRAYLNHCFELIGGEMSGSRC